MKIVALWRALFIVLLGASACSSSAGGSHPTSASGASNGSLSSCGHDEVCVQGVLAAATCFGNDGSIPGDGATCDPAGDGQECGSSEACMIMQLPEGDIGRCVRLCRPIEDRPNCVAGCFNQVCSGPRDMCSREHGACRPVPCANDSDCAALIECDYPTRRGPRFACEAESGQCLRVAE